MRILSNIVSATISIVLVVTTAQEGVASVTTHVLPSVAKADATVEVDDGLDAFVGDGGLLLPHSFEGTEQSRQQVANCLTCVWKYTLYCSADSSLACAHAVTTCGVNLLRYRVKFGTNAESVETIGSVCWGTRKPATRIDVTRRVNSSALRFIPPLLPGHIPQGGSVASVPVIYWAGQHQNFVPRPMYLGGLKISIQVSAQWHWTWGDGTSTWTSNPGVPQEMSGPSHRYRRAHTYLVTVESLWTPSYAVDGIGRFTSDSAPIHQSQRMYVHILASGTRLTRG